MKIVVTGATGHLGGVFCRAAIAAGHQLSEFTRARAELDHDACIAPLAGELGADVALVHLAAWHPANTAATGAAERRRLLETNVHGTMRVLEAARRAGARVVVFASTFEVYGDVADLPITERSRVQPITDYGATKLSGEDHLLSFGYEQKTRVVALRMPAVYGRGEKTPRALPNFLAAVARGALPEIHGDGRDLRDQLHVTDAARALLLAVEGDAHGIFNVSDGEQHSVRQIAELAVELAGLSGAPVERPRNKPRRDYHMSIGAARRELRFEPKTPLRAGMADQLAWLRSEALR